MSTNTPQNRSKKDQLPFLIAFAAAFALLASFLMGWLTPANSSAALSNGGFCIPAHDRGNPEIKGMAGNCKPRSAEPSTPAPVVKTNTQTVVVGGVGSQHGTKYSNASWHATLTLADGTSVEESGVANTIGDFSSGEISVVNRSATATSATLTLEIGGDTLTWQIPSSDWIGYDSTDETLKLAAPAPFNYDPFQGWSPDPDNN